MIRCLLALSISAVLNNANPGDVPSLETTPTTRPFDACDYFHPARRVRASDSHQRASQTATLQFAADVKRPSTSRQRVQCAWNSLGLPPLGGPAKSPQVLPPIRAVIFDLGGVVVGKASWKDAFWASRLLRINPIVVALQLPSVMGPVVCGQADEEQTLSAFAQAHGGALPLNWRSLAMAHYRATVPVRAEIVDYVRELQKAGMQTPLLSNTIPFHADVDRARGVHQIFSPIFLSYEMGMKKPGQPIFQRALEELMLLADACVFIDDRQENIDAAKRAGMSALLFSSLSRLKRDLIELGVAQ